MTRKECCPNCNKSVVGLYQNIVNRERQVQRVRRAYYCKHCKLVLPDNVILYKKIIYEKKKDI